MNERKWQRNFLQLASTVAGFSKDPSTQVGAVIVDPSNRIVSMGYNGFPKGIEDDQRLLDRKTKYDIIIHAELNALLFAKQPLDGCTIYTWPFMPCSRCAAMIIQCGITKVVSIPSSISRWSENFELSQKLFHEAGVDLILTDFG